MLVFGAATVANAEHEKDGSTQKPYESREYPRATPDTDYGTRGDRQEQRYKEQRFGTDSSPYEGSYSADDLYDHTGNDGTGPRLKGRY